MIIYGKYKRPEKVFEKIDKERITEQAGYMPADVQVRQFLEAGQRLNEYRREAYDFGVDEEIDLDLEVPVRDPNFDMADASQIMREVEFSIEQQKLEALKAIKAYKDSQELLDVPDKKVDE